MNKWINIPLIRDGKNIKNINIVKYIGNETIFIGTKNYGLFKLKLESRAQHNYSFLPITDLKEKSITCIVKSEINKKLYLGTEHGLYSLDLSTDLVESVHYRNTFTHIGINSIYIDNSFLWIGIPGGLSSINLLKKKDNYYTSKVTPLGLGGSNINKIIKDREGNYWVASSLYGLFKFNKFNKNIKRLLTHTPGNNTPDNISIWDIREDGSGYLWVGTIQHGLIKLNPKTGLFDNYIIEEKKRSNLQTKHVNRVFLSKKNRILTGFWGIGVLQFDPLKKKFHHIINTSTGLLSDHVLSFNETEKGDLLIGTVAGGLQLLKFDNSIKTDPIYFKDEQYKPFNAAVIKKDIVKKEIFWIGTFTKGLLKYNSQTNELKKCASLRDIKNTPSIRIHYIYQSEKDPELLYVGTANGVIQFNIKKNKWNIFSKKKIINHCTTVGIIEDETGYLWISTFNGILKYNPENDEVLFYSELNNAVGQEFNEGSCTKVSDGSFLFGSPNGIVSFLPEKIKKNNYLNRISFFYYRINDSKLSLINKNMENHLRFKNNQRIVFGFSAISMLESQKNKYKFKLSPVDKNWKNLNTNGIIPLSDLKPGDYELFIMGSNNDKVWAQDHSSIKFEVYSENTSFIFTIILSGLLMFFLITVFLLRKIKSQRKKERIIQINDMKVFLKKNGITPREQEVLKLWIEGKSREEIEAILFISYHTVKNHIHNIYKKLKVSNRGELLLKVKYEINT